jgi:predicted phage terminase large subunit-like protein
MHPVQQDFLQSKATFRAFCGGIGSGKSWAGSYDLIRRAVSGRLYMVVAPTYSMLSDSTFRSFLTVAEDLGVVDPGQVKRSAPPSIRLRTGAEVLFRSGDEPERLRGPNLSGIWIDEASLLSVDTYHIAIGRLREGGQQGWLTATFTPRGRRHWTYEAFATGRPGTALFTARTADNPFLPEGFDATVRPHYTSALAAQELEGQFLDQGGTLFQRDWFAVVDQTPALVRRVRAWDLAATPKDESKAHDPDWTVGVLLGKDAAGTYYVLDVRRLRGTPQQVQALVQRTAVMDGRGVPIWMEQEPGSSGVTVIDYYRRLLAGHSFHGERSTGNKAERAAPLAAQAEGGTVKLVRAGWNRDFLDEFEVFPFGGHDDVVDATTLAFNHLTALQRLWYRLDGVTYDFGAGPTAEADSARYDGGVIVEENTAMGRMTTIPAFPKVRAIDLLPGAPGWIPCR